ncbi:MAG TPA: hypothetical protein VH476_10850 [Solirubrobacterales bacterium]
MEIIDRDRLARLLDAVREADALPTPDETQEEQPVAVRRSRTWLAVRALGALAVLTVGAVHLQQYLKLYSAIPTIGTLFVLNFAAATAIGLGLLAPVERLLGRRFGYLAPSLLALAGVGLAATAFVFLAISEQTPLFGFMEPGYDPTAILVSRIAEGATVALLGAYLAARLAGRADRGWW